MVWSWLRKPISHLMQARPLMWWPFAFRVRWGWLCISAISTFPLGFRCGSPMKMAYGRKARMISGTMMPMAAWRREMFPVKWP